MEVEVAGEAVADPGRPALLKLESRIHCERYDVYSHVPIRLENTTNTCWIFFFYQLGVWLDFLQRIYDQN